MKVAALPEFPLDRAETGGQSAGAALDSTASEVHTGSLVRMVEALFTFSNCHPSPRPRNMCCFWLRMRGELFTFDLNQSTSVPCDCQIRQHSSPTFCVFICSLRDWMRGSLRHLKSQNPNPNSPSQNFSDDPAKSSLS